MATLEDVKTWRGRTAYDRDGDKIGKIEDVYLDRNSGEPEWLAVKTGLFGSNVSFVPIGDASSQGDDVRVGHEKDVVKDAPNVEADGELSPEEERRLYQHYGRSDYDEWSDASEDPTSARYGDDRRSFGDGDRLASDTEGRSFGDGDRVRDDADATGTVGHDTSGPTTDDAMTRSEEELAVGTQRQERGRARLRKWVETEQVEETVPVRREEVRVEREPITDANVDRAVGGPDISEEEHEVVLYEEEPVVEKRAVPKERVRLDKDLETGEETVTDEVRKERIEVEGDAERRL
ncbi:MAG: hypothetical protein QOJ21_2718 [Solirubrobacteraceae bacterium]|jgi:uncharacterized protein (TIGR02271 family)|nr:hypothetical protein [Solirubrobacteraceae bacterium]